LGVEILPIIEDRETYLGVRAYAELREVPGEVDVLLVYPERGLPLRHLAKEAIEKGVNTFWVEEGQAEPEVRELLADARVQVVERESLEREYVKNFPFPFHERKVTQAGQRSATVRERMTANPVTVTPRESLHDAIEKMTKGHFRHLPVVDDPGALIGILSDRDIRLIRPSRAFVSAEDEGLQLWSTSVRQAAAFDPVTIEPDAPLEKAAELLLRWEIGGLPVVDNSGKPVGIITYADLLREFLARGK
jgi:CBS domain-containing protein